MNRLLILFTLLCTATLHAQEYDDYIGAGHANGITVTTSHNAENTDGLATINGVGMDAPAMEAARFLSQAGFGGNMDDVQQVMDMGFEQWIDNQMAMPRTVFYDELNDIWDFILNMYLSIGEEEEDIFGPSGVTFNYTWFQNMMTKPDQLRQKVAFELSQIFVISAESDLGGYADALSTYYDILMEHALGNYRDLLHEISLHPAMGLYLSHLNNQKADPENNIHPDENFAREIMQLFSIGIYELNMDGSYKLGTDGLPIQTYDLNDIKELAKVFTGLSVGGANFDMCWWLDDIYFGLDMYCADRTIPMIMYEEWHEQGPKEMFGGEYVIPAGQSGMQDIDMAIDILFNHPNVPPFMARHLIQKLITSNPSPQFIERIANVFVDNGEGERGDLGAVVKAILLDPEARTCDAMADPDHGRLREPVMRFANILKAVETANYDSDWVNYWHNGYNLLDQMGQTPLHSPTVFNFFKPDYQISDGVYGPEFEVLNTVTTAGYFNEVQTWTQWALLWDWNPEEYDDPTTDEYDPRPLFDSNRLSIDEEWMGNKVTDIGYEGFMNELDILLSHGQLSDEYRNNLRSVYQYFKDDAPWLDNQWIARHLIYFMMTSPDYIIVK